MKTKEEGNSKNSDSATQNKRSVFEEANPMNEEMINKIAKSTSRSNAFWKEYSFLFDAQLNEKREKI